MNTDKPNYKKARRPSVSVTDLVAQIAGQVAHEQVQKLEDEIMAKLNSFDLSRDSETYKRLQRELTDLKNELRAHRIKEIKDADLDRITNSLQRSGFSWPAEEDRQLRDEFKLALETIAVNHGRSAHGIRCRIQDKDLLKNTQFG